MAESQVAASRARFGGYELDLRSGELAANGKTLRLQDQSFRLLRALLEQAGEVVTREELQRQLWPAETFVDFDHGLNKAVAKLRDVLDDPESETSLIETLPRRGYRFVAAVEWLAPRDSQPKVEAGPVATTAQPRHWRAQLTAVALAALMVAGWLIWRNVRGPQTAPAATIHSIAVLPLVNLSGDASQEYFADGMTDELITMLAKNTSLRVVSRTSVMRYKGVTRPLHDIARELRVDGILEGSISHSANRIHLTVQLVQGENDAHLWADSYDRDSSDALTLLSELSRTIAREVKVATMPRAQPQKKLDPEALSAYLRGRDLWLHGEYGKAQDFYEKAIRADPNYAPAWSGLADVYGGLAVDQTAPSAEFRDKAMAAARKGLELDDSLGEAHTSMAAVQYFLEWDWKDADRESLRGTQLNPSSSEAHHLRSYILGTLNRPEEALQEQKLASQLDPDLRPVALGRAYLHLRRYDDAVRELRAREQEHPHTLNLHSELEDAYYFAGMTREAVEECAEIYRAAGDTDAAAAVEREFARGGEQAVALWQLKHWKRTAGRSYADLYGLAEICARAGLKEDALRALERAYKQRTTRMVWLQLNPNFDILHSEPRYRELVQKMGLPPMY